MQDWSRFVTRFPDIVALLLSGAVMTVLVSAGAFVVSLVLGLLFGGLQTSKNRALRALASVYVELFRAVPVLTQLFVIYFGLAAIGLRLSPIPAAVIGFGLNGGAYLTEIFRGGITGVGRGQMEAALALGMTRLEALRLVVLPQAIRIVLPGLVNFAIGLVKDTSLASAVAAPEVSFNANILIKETYLSTQIYIMVAFIYLAISMPLSSLGRMLERRTGQGRRA